MLFTMVVYGCFDGAFLLMKKAEELIGMPTVARSWRATMIGGRRMISLLQIREKNPCINCEFVEGGYSSLIYIYILYICHISVYEYQLMEPNFIPNNDEDQRQK